MMNQLKIWKVVHDNYHFFHIVPAFAWMAYGKPRRTSVRITSVRADVWTRDLLTQKQQCHHSPLRSELRCVQNGWRIATFTLRYVLRGGRNGHCQIQLGEPRQLPPGSFRLLGFKNSYSILKWTRIKTYFRSTMGQERRDGLAMLSINQNTEVTLKRFKWHLPGDILEDCSYSLYTTIFIFLICF
jgi:hypothetical protein